MALALGLVEEDAGGDGGVEAFDAGRVGDEDGFVGGVEEGAGDSLALAANEDGGGEAEVDLLNGAAFVAGGDGEADAVLVKGGEGLGGGEFDAGEAEDRSGRGAGDLGIGGGDGSLKGQQAAGSEGFGGAEDGAEVAGVLEPGTAEDERRVRADEVLQGRDEGVDEGGDPLRGFRGDGAVEDVVGEEDGFGGVAELGEEAVGALAGGFGKEDGAQAEAAADGLFDELGALDGDGSVLGGGGLGEGLAELLDKGILAAGDGAEAVGERDLGQCSSGMRRLRVVECWSACKDMITPR